MSDSSAPAVRMRRIVKSFGPVEVLKEVDLDIHAGEVHALAGENGAGKSTLMKVLQGVHPITSGEIEVNGEPVKIRNPADAERVGIGMVFQEFSLVPSMTVAQNIFLNRELRSKLGLIDDRAAEREAARIFADLGVSIDPAARVETLGTAYWQLVEIAKAVAKNATVLVMDEPTASLASHEVERLFELIERLTARGIAIVYISHRMDEIRRVAQRITVLRDGRVVLSDRVADVEVAQIIEAIIGRRLASDLVYRERERGVDDRVILAAEHVASDTGLVDVDVTVRAGEIVGLAGLMGSGRTEFARVIAGIDRPSSGTIRIDGRTVSFRSALAAQRAGIALIPEDRREQGLVLEHSVSANLMLPVLDRLMAGILVSTARMRAMTQDLVERFSVKTADPYAPVNLLSGGNQQKVVVAKWINTDPKLLVMDEPTAGVDIGTKTEILDIVRDYASQGNAVLFISSELPELLAVADRVVVLRGGRTDRELTRSQISSEEQLQLIIQGEAA
ncbi:MULTISPECIES: sugar ABC transporter ATP-binding protein [Microbacterium]|uniref:sugar ABC transporter ATP-binding protein n=1 Tax=Microbacterium TaxID=33882 RepID=UPI001D176E9B|nr:MULTISPECIES: sugar ABC transporter ATP-binding protein [Microbacterium]MCC4266734.1 sugar ABC transporter ATP-binding protein [Microbacterium schleiferi]